MIDVNEYLYQESNAMSNIPMAKSLFLRFDVALSLHSKMLPILRFDVAFTLHSKMLLTLRFDVALSLHSKMLLTFSTDKSVCKD